MIVFLRSSSVGDNTNTAPASPQATGVEEQCALAASEAKKLESGEAGTGWERLEGWEVGQAEKLGPASITHLSQLMCTTIVSWPSRAARQPSAAVETTFWHFETLMSFPQL